MQYNLGSEHEAIIGALRDLKAPEPIPVGVLGKMYLALDKMRAAHAPSQDIAIIEQLSVGIRRLESARRQRDEVTEQSVRESLNSLASSWIEKHPALVGKLAEAAE